MLTNKYDRGFIFSVLMLSAVLLGLTMLTAVAFAAPTIEMTASPPNPQVNQIITIIATAMDNGSSLNGTMEFLANGSSFDNKTITGGIASTTYTTANAGTATITAKLNDTQKSITVDFSAPALSLSANPTIVTAGTATDVTFIVTPLLNDVLVTLSGAGVSVNGTTTTGIVIISVNATGDGPITATASRSGYISDTATITAKLPTLPPLAISANPTNVTVGTATDVVFTVTGKGSAVNGSTVTLSGAGVSISNITDASGIVSISINATDKGTITATASLSNYSNGTVTITTEWPPLTVIANPANVTVGIATDVVFTVTSNGSLINGATVTLSGAGVSVSNTTDANGSVTISVNATSAGNIAVIPTMTRYTGVSIILTAHIVVDTTPPESITNLTMEDHGTSWIKWNWTLPNPIGDLSYVAIWINNIWTSNVSVPGNSFNTSGILNLVSGTEYKIETHTVDTSRNLNTTGINLTSSTLPNTPNSTGEITVTLGFNSSVTFPTVILGGNTVETIDDGGHPLPTTSYILVGKYHNISTTATYTTPVNVSIQYDPSLVPPYSVSDIRLYHWNDSTGIWDSLTTSSASGMVTGQVSSLSPFVPAIPAKPSITKVPSNPPDPIETIVNSPQTFNIIVDQTANVTWYINSTQVTNTSNYPANTGINYTNIPSSSGNYNVSVKASNDNGTDTEYWNWTVHPTTFSTGNRIWDGSKPNDFALTYTWNPMSFSGFYYNVKDDVGNENITITLGSYSTQTISKNNLVYTTSPQEVSFTYSNFGKYQVIGFMAEKYFAGYSQNTTPPNPKPSTTFDGISAVGQGQLHKVLIDDDTKRTISVGGTIALQEGYVLKATDIDLNARTMLLSLLKDGNEVDVSPLAENQTYIYTKRVGGVEDLPIIMVRFENVFSGRELQVAFMKGLFQISENPTIIKNGNTFRNMQITQVNNNLIEMKNSNDISLSKGTTADVMGDVKILVANNVDSALRFALSVDKTGDFEVRSTVYRDANPVNLWTPYNFGMNIGKTSLGFYYDLDSGVGGESLSLTNPLVNGSRNIPDQNLLYSTTPQEVNFIYTGFGKYQVIGFMADKYFAGYTSNTNPTVTKPTTDFAGKSSLANGALHKVWIDDDTKRTISVGGTIALKEGYVLKATDIDLNARVMLLSLLKDGVEVDITPLGAGETYIYAKTVGGTESLPLIMVRFDSVFSGRELQVAFLKGIFQISDTPTKIKTTDQFGKMRIRTVSGNAITMSNDGIISLDKNKNDVLMGNLKLKVADNDNLRFYFAVDVTAEMIQNQLVIDAPAKATAGDTIKIKITAGGVGMDGATVNIGTNTGTTDKDGILNYTIPRSLNGTYSIAASKTGYESATQNIEIGKYIDYTLSIQAPSQANQSETITIKVLYNGTAMSGATVTFDNTTVGTTDSNGEVTYKLETSGTHSISASMKSYLPVMRDIEIRALYSEFKALDINLTPNQGFIGDSFQVISNITNVGTKSDSLQVELIVNGTAVDNKTITVDAGGKVEVNFTRTETVAGNVTVEIMGQSMLYETKEKPTNYLLYGVIVTVIGAIAIYIITSKGLLNLDSLKEKFNGLFKKGK